MKEYKSNKYKYIKMTAKVGSSKSNTTNRKKATITGTKRTQSGCGGCSRRAR